MKTLPALGGLVEKVGPGEMLATAVIQQSYRYHHEVRRVRIGSRGNGRSDHRTITVHNYDGSTMSEDRRRRASSNGRLKVKTLLDQRLWYFLEKDGIN